MLNSFPNSVSFILAAIAEILDLIDKSHPVSSGDILYIEKLLGLDWIFGRYQL